MRTRPGVPLSIAAVAAALWIAPVASVAAQAAPATATSQKQLPAELSDSVYWGLISNMSEQEWDFNRFMVSNEVFYTGLVNRLTQLNLSGGAYIGVAPEQNYHYIAALRPQIAFILDIRRERVMQHLMFKAIFELSNNRADFISLLFTKPRPAGIPATATAFQTFQAFWYVPTDTTKYKANYTRLLDHLTKKHKFPLSSYDSSQFMEMYSRFYWAGPNLVANGNAGSETATGTFGNITTLAEPGTGIERSFLANEEVYQVVRQMHLKNLIVPIVGDFAGSHALRSIGRFLHEHNTQLTAFYASNVEFYLRRDGKERLFYQNVATLPFHARSVFISGESPGAICTIQQVVGPNYYGCR